MVYYLYRIVNLVLPDLKYKELKIYGNIRIYYCFYGETLALCTINDYSSGIILYFLNAVFQIRF